MASTRSLRSLTGSGGGNTREFMQMASDLFSTRSAQGQGKTIDDRASFASEGSPSQFLEFAGELRRQLTQRGS